MPEVYVSAGSNIEPRRHLQHALAVLARIYTDVRCSPVYSNRSVGFDGDDFFNCVVGFETQQDVSYLMNQLREVEDECGRDRDLPRFGPRSVDLDLLLYGNFVGELDGLRLPRQEVLEQAYVLKPLSDLVPDMKHPVSHRSFQTHWNEFDQQAHVLTEIDLDCG
jgi:2-amino-4-hydroxy-6-hydroxymethyldihydropteridine diphosphokinase